MDIHRYMQKELQMAVKTTSNRSVSQLSLSFDNDAVSAKPSVLAK